MARFVAATSDRAGSVEIDRDRTNGPQGPSIRGGQGFKSPQLHREDTPSLVLEPSRLHHVRRIVAQAQPAAARCRRTRTSPRSRREFAAEPIGLLLVLVAALTFTGESAFAAATSSAAPSEARSSQPGAPDPLTSAGGQGESPCGSAHLRRRLDARASEEGGAMPAGRSISGRHAERVWFRRRVGVVARAERVPAHGRC